MEIYKKRVSGKGYISAATLADNYRANLKGRKLRRREGLYKIRKKKSSASEIENSEN
jgi:hypothetical protein